MCSHKYELKGLMKFKKHKPCVYIHVIFTCEQYSSALDLTQK